MAKTSLTDMQRIILSGASMRFDLKVLPVPKSLQKSNIAIGLSLKPLLAKKLISEVTAGRDDAVWREDAAHGKFALVITAAGMEAIGVSAEGQCAAGPEVTDDTGCLDGKTGAHSSAPARDQIATGQLPRAGSKLSQLIAALHQPSGATIPDMMEATGWQAHSIRGAMSGALKKKLGLCITSELSENRGRVYRIMVQEAPPADAVARSPQNIAPGGDQQVDQSHPGDTMAGAA